MVSAMLPLHFFGRIEPNFKKNQAIKNMMLPRGLDVWIPTPSPLADGGPNGTFHVPLKKSERTPCQVGRTCHVQLGPLGKEGGNAEEQTTMNAKTNQFEKGESGFAFYPRIFKNPVS